MIGRPASIQVRMWLKLIVGVEPEPTGLKYAAVNPEYIATDPRPTVGLTANSEAGMPNAQDMSSVQV
jgi:hypothetical protein